MRKELMWLKKATDAEGEPTLRPCKRDDADLLQIILIDDDPAGGEFGLALSLTHWPDFEYADLSPLDPYLKEGYKAMDAYLSESVG